MPVYQFQHLGRYLVIPLGLEPRTLSLKVRCSNRLSYGIEQVPLVWGGKDIQNFVRAKSRHFFFGGRSLGGINLACECNEAVLVGVYIYNHEQIFSHPRLWDAVFGGLRRGLRSTQLPV